MRPADIPTVRSPVVTTHPTADGAPLAQFIELSSINLASTPAPPELDWPRVRGYEILSLVGTGGMGMVYKARHRELRRIVALKTLRGAAAADPEFRERFQSEAEAVARLQHPNIIQVFEVGTVQAKPGELDPAPFIALEFVDGSSLSKHTAAPQPPEFAARTVETLARAAHAAHRLGVVHRDLKPANVLLTRSGEPKIADFGLAKRIDLERDGGGRFVTQAGIAVGTPEYMAPEQVAGEDATASIDIHALGVILYELLTARVPFQGPTPSDTMYSVRHEEPVSPRRLQPRLPRDLETICLKCLAKAPARRYETADALADDLNRWLKGQTIRARPIGNLERGVRWARRNPTVASLWGAVVCVALIGIAGVIWKWREAETRTDEAKQLAADERREHYRAEIIAASSALQLHDGYAAQRALDLAPEEHRNWEWRHFASRLDLAQKVVRLNSTTYGVAIASNGNRAFAYGKDDEITTWDFNATSTKQLVWKRPGAQGSALSPDGNWYAVQSDSAAIEIRDFNSNRLRSVLRGHEQPLLSLHYSADAARLASGSHDQFVRVWDCATGRLLVSCRPYESGLSGAIVSPDCRRMIASQTGNKKPRLWNLETGAPIATLPDHEHGLQLVCFTDSGDRAVTVEGFPLNRMRLWNTANGELIETMSGHDNMVTNVAFCADGTRFASGSMDQTIQLWDGVTGKPIAKLKGHRGRVDCVAFSPDGKRLVSASTDHTARLWHGVTGEPLGHLNGHTNGIHAVRFSADSTRVITGASDNTLRVWDVESIEHSGKLRGHTSFVYSVAFHRDGRRVASSAWDGTARLWDVATGKQLRAYDHGKNTIVSSVAIHPGGKLLATRVRNAAFLWDLETGEQLQRWEAPSDPWRDTRLAFSPRGDLLVGTSFRDKLHLWDVASRKEVAVLTANRDDIRDVAFSPDGKWLATAGDSGDRTIQIWDMDARRRIRVLEGHGSCVYAVAFNRDGTQLASGSTDGTARLWDTANWSQGGVLKHGVNVYGLAFTPDGKRLACGCADNSIRLWDTAKLQLVAELRGHSDYVHELAFSPDGSQLISASGDKTLRIWDTKSSQERNE